MGETDITSPRGSSVRSAAGGVVAAALMLVGCVPLGEPAEDPVEEQDEEQGEEQDAQDEPDDAPEEQPDVSPEVRLSLQEVERLIPAGHDVPEGFEMLGSIESDENVGDTLGDRREALDSQSSFAELEIEELQQEHGEDAEECLAGIEGHRIALLNMVDELGDDTADDASWAFATFEGEAGTIEVDSSSQDYELPEQVSHAWNERVRACAEFREEFEGFEMTFEDVEVDGVQGIVGRAEEGGVLLDVWQQFGTAYVEYTAVSEDAADEDELLETIIQMRDAAEDELLRLAD